MATTTILLSVVTVVEFASSWQMVFYTGSVSHVVLSARMSVSLRSSMHIKIDMAFLVVLRLVHPIYVSSVLLLHDSLHSLFTPVCLSVTRQGALHVLKGIPQLFIPSSQGWGSDISISTAHGFFFWRLFVCYCFVSVRAQEKNTTSLVLWPCRVPTCVVPRNLLIKPTVPA